MLALLPSRRVLAQIGSWEITWYGALYVASFGLAWWLLPRLARWRGIGLTSDARLAIVAWGAAGGVIGGRLGYVLLYEPSYFLAHPLQALALWEGGMASHGGFLGAAAALWLVAWRFKYDRLALADAVVVPAALGLALGRLGNWVNQELFVSTAAHAAVIGKDVLIAGLCYAHLRFTTPFPPAAGSPLPPVQRANFGKEGQTLALFLILYGVLRFLAEYVRQPLYSSVLGMTYGQVLTLPIFAAGVWLMVWLRQSAPRNV